MKKIAKAILIILASLCLFAGITVLLVFHYQDCKTLSEFNNSAIKKIASMDNNENFIVSSPNGEISISVFVNNGIPAYSVSKNNTEIIQPSTLGLITSICDFSEGVELTNISEIKYFNEEYTLLSSKKRVCNNTYNERIFTFSKNEAELLITFRTYDDGIAFSYSMKNDTDFEISGENTSYIIKDTAMVWHNNCYKENYEFQYEKSKITTLAHSLHRDYKFILMPLLIRLDDGTYMQICETNLNGEYSGTMLSPNNKKNCVVLRTSFVKSQKDNVKAFADFESPWRYIVIGNEAEIVENTMATNLADEPDDNIDYSFVEAGSTSWTWLDNERDMNEWGGYYQHDTEAIKKHLELAGEMGWNYYIMDEGWQPPCDNGIDRYSGYYDDFTEWKKCADDNGIGLIAWCFSSDLNTEEKRKRLTDWKAHGIAGIKVDFFDAENQKTLKLYEDIYKTCAENEMIVIAHGANKSIGEERTYPNVLTKEGIYGQEQGNISAKNSVTCAFTRYATGNTDYTEYLIPRDTNTTAGFQLAMSFICTSGVHCFADGVTNYRTNESAQIMLKDFPPYYDETKYIAGNPSDYISLARRYKNIWYVTGISNIDMQQEIIFDFLDDKKYQATIFTDGDDYLSTDKQIKTITKNDKLTIHISENGGYAIKIEEK